MKAPSPAFSFYPKDILSDGLCTAMTDEEFGVYVRLLCHAWLEGSIPADPTRLARVTRRNRKSLDRIWPAIAPCFEEREGRLFQKRLEKERAKQVAFSESQSAKASKPRKSRRINKTKKPRLSPAKPGPNPAVAQPSLPSPSSFPSPSTNENGRQEERAARPPNPHVDRDAMVREGNALIREIAPKADLDPTEVMAKASFWKGRSYVRLDTMPADNDRLAHTVGALRSWARRLRGDPEPELPESRASPHRQTAAEATGATVRQVLAEEAAKRDRESAVRSGTRGDLDSAQPAPGAGHPGRVPPGARGRD